MDGDEKYEQYMEKFRITEWRDGCVYATESLGCDWFPAETVQGNRPGSTGIMYVAASDDFARTHASIRRQKT